MTIRLAQPTEYEHLSRLWLQASLKSHYFIPAAYWLANRKLMKELYLPAAENYLYQSAQGIAGFVSLMDDTIAALFIAPEQQGQGIGKQLLNHVKTLRPQLQLNVFLQNHRAKIFYQKHGFSIVKKGLDAATDEWQLTMVYPKLQEFNT